MTHRIPRIGIIGLTFRENTCMHPYVSGGLKLGMLDEHTVRESGTKVLIGIGIGVGAAALLAGGLIAVASSD